MVLPSELASAIVWFGNRVLWLVKAFLDYRRDDTLCKKMLTVVTFVFNLNVGELFITLIAEVESDF
jgi:hypothetical protein